MEVRKVEVNGEEWTLEGNPTMGTVKYVQNLQMEMFKDKLSQEEFERLAEEDDGDIDEGELMKRFVDNEGIDGMMEMMWDNTIMGPLQTISLAADRRVTFDEIEKMPALDFKELRDKSEEVLGGDAEDFFDKLELVTSLKQNATQEMNNQQSSESPPGTRSLVQKSE